MTTTTTIDPHYYGVTRHRRTPTDTVGWDVTFHHIVGNGHVAACGARFDVVRSILSAQRHVLSNPDEARHCTACDEVTYPAVELDRTAPLPVDWRTWRPLWRAYRDEVAGPDADGRVAPTGSPFPKLRNLLADEVLVVWDTPAGVVELSEVTFPALGRGGERRRYVGLTFATPQPDGSTTRLCDTFADLDDALGLTEPTT